MNAQHYATEHHKNQYRKGDHSPYIVHPQAVAEKLKEIGVDRKTIEIGWLHDTIEDTSATYEDTIGMLTASGTIADSQRVWFLGEDRAFVPSPTPRIPTNPIADLHVEGSGQAGSRSSDRRPMRRPSRGARSHRDRRSPTRPGWRNVPAWDSDYP